MEAFMTTWSEIKFLSLPLCSYRKYIVIFTKRLLIKRNKNREKSESSLIVAPQSIYLLTLVGTKFNLICRCIELYSVMLKIFGGAIFQNTSSTSHRKRTPASGRLEDRYTPLVVVTVSREY